MSRRIVAADPAATLERCEDGSPSEERRQFREQLLRIGFEKSAEIVDVGKVPQVGRLRRFGFRKLSDPQQLTSKPNRGGAEVAQSMMGRTVPGQSHDAPRPA